MPKVFALKNPPLFTLIFAAQLPLGENVTVCKSLLNNGTGCQSLSMEKPLTTADKKAYYRYISMS